jgi:aerobic carbon-monoxide dehydrogenase small subunit
MKRSVTLNINGSSHTILAEPRTLLVHALRDDLNLTGTHIGCDTSQCGACTVLIDGQAVKSCTVFAMQAEGRQVTTIEGIGTAERLHPVQQAFWDKHGLQCGFCTPGMIMSAIDLLSSNPDPTDEQIRHGIEGNMCRCTGYQNIVAAVRSAAEAMRGAEVAGAGAARQPARAVGQPAGAGV